MQINLKIGRLSEILPSMYLLPWYVQISFVIASISLVFPLSQNLIEIYITLCLFCHRTVKKECTMYETHNLFLLGHLCRKIFEKNWTHIFIYLTFLNFHTVKFLVGRALSRPMPSHAFGISYIKKFQLPLYYFKHVNTKYLLFTCTILPTHLKFAFCIEK